MYNKKGNSSHKNSFNFLNIGRLNPLTTHFRAKKFNTINFIWFNIVLILLNITHILLNKI